MWKAITYVSSSLTLIAFAIAVAAWTYRNKLLQIERLIRSAPEDSRPALVEQALEFFPVDTQNLTKQQKYLLALKQIQERSTRFRITSIVVVIIAIIFASLTIFAIIHLTSGGNQTPIGTPENTSEKGTGIDEASTNREPNSNIANISMPDLKLVDVFMPTKNTVEFKIKNGGDDSAFLKSLTFVFEEGRRVCMLYCNAPPAFVYTVEARINENMITIKPNYLDKVTGKPPTLPKINEGATSGEKSNSQSMHDFFKNLKFTNHANPSLKISQSVPPRGVDRFQVKFNIPGLTPAIGYYIFRGYAIIDFDVDQTIKTEIFEIQLKP